MVEALSKSRSATWRSLPQLPPFISYLLFAHPNPTTNSTMKHSKVPHKKAAILPAFLGAFLTVQLASGGILLQETFPANGRTTQNLPTTAAWYAGAMSGGSIDESVAGRLAYRYSSGSWVWSLTSYFTDSEPVDLEVGESLKVTIVFEAEISDMLPSDNTLRIGVLNSGEIRLTGDVRNGAAVTFNDYTGYVTHLIPTQTNSGAVMTESKRDKTGDYPLSGGSMTAMTGRKGAGQSVTNSMQSGVVYTFEVVYTRVSDLEVHIAASLTGDNTSNYVSEWTDSSSPYTSFDTLILGSTNETTLRSITLHEVTVSRGIE